jgi:hypothetical protein
MLRIDREKLNEAIEAVSICAVTATDVSGNKVLFLPKRDDVEHAILGALSIIAPHGGPCTASDVKFLAGFGTAQVISFPPDTKKSGEKS